MISAAISMSLIAIQDRPILLLIKFAFTNVFADVINDIQVKNNNRITKELKTDFNTEELTKNNIASIIEDYEINKVDELKKNTPLLLKTFNRRIKNLKRGINTDFSLINSYTKSNPSNVFSNNFIFL